MDVRPLNANDCAEILLSDQAIYPSPSPVSKETMNRWYVRHPDFGLLFTEGSERVGVLACVPVTISSWRELRGGRIKESQLDEGTLFDVRRDTTFVIHVYHIERFSAHFRRFHEIAFAELGVRVVRLTSAKGSPTIAGFSALCTTPEGIRLFSRELRFKESGYVCKEHVVRRSDGRTEIRMGEEKAVRSGLGGGLMYVCRGQFLILTPEDKSGLWKMFDGSQA